MPEMWGAAGKVSHDEACLENVIASIVKPALRMAASVSRVVWHPPNIRGQ